MTSQELTFPDRVRLPLRFDMAAMAADALALDPQDWLPHFNTAYYEGDWSGAALRAVGGRSDTIYPDPASVEPWADTPLLARCPAIAAALARIECEMTSVRLLRLGPGARVKEHRDHALGYEDGECRLHIPVVAGPEAEFVLAGVPLEMAEGDCWYVNVNNRHFVYKHWFNPTYPSGGRCLCQRLADIGSTEGHRRGRGPVLNLRPVRERMRSWRSGGRSSRERWWLVSVISRRTLLRTGVALSAVAGPVVWAGSASAAPRSRLAGRAAHASHAPGKWSRANFQPHLRKSFTLTSHSGRVTVTLAEIGNLVGGRAANEQHQYSLLFKARRTAELPEGLYTLRGANFQPMTLFVSPVDRGRRARYLQAVVNRLA